MSKMQVNTRRSARSERKSYKAVKSKGKVFSISVKEVDNTGKHFSVKEVPTSIEQPKRSKMSHKRTGPNGKRAMVSDSAVVSIANDMEERTKKAISTIGRSTGF